MDAGNCVLKLNHLVFDEICFHRSGFQNTNELNIEFSFKFEDRENGEFVSRLRLVGTKADEYNFVVCASGFFEIGPDVQNRDKMIRQNSVAIVFPYIRSQVSLLTAQPEVEPIVLPPVNIAKMVEDSMTE